MQQATDTAGRDDPFDLHRFTSAQERVYDQAVAELRLCCKKGHWIWYIFPQIEGLGQSSIFAFVAPLGSVFTRVLNKYFNGTQDGETLRILGQLGG